MTKENTILVPRLPSACAYAEYISNLQVLTPRGPRRFSGSSISGGHFTHLIASREGIVLLLAPALEAPHNSPSFYGNSSSAKLTEERALYVMPVDFADTDWLLAVEDQGGCDPGWVYHLLYGKLPEGSKTTYELYDNIKQAVLLTENSKGTIPFATYQLWPNQPAVQTA